MRASRLCQRPAAGETRWGAGIAGAAKAAHQALADPTSVPVEVVEFRDVPLQDAMRLLSQQTSVKIVPSEEAGKKKVSLFLENVTPLVAVEAVSQANGLIFRRDADTGIIRIFTTKENQRRLEQFPRGPERSFHDAIP